MRKTLFTLGLALALSALPGIAMAEKGMASYYADSLDGNLTASGEPYDKDAMTAAHRSLPFGTVVKVYNLDNDREVIVTINDRGPHVENRIIDLSGAAAAELGLLDAGIARVRLEVQD